ncbi:uncharacterized protein LOC126176783 [Schistocerca cancellata]|uniref:uncharacterized protein LOC126176783 n=1 Tax=Schistocerca cancellata TaxID=274614 RepID=UPI002119B6FC|nr:uncharacterized protein LOC126176783 [Schistocerca cancellata]
MAVFAARVPRRMNRWHLAWVGKTMAAALVVWLVVATGVVRIEVPRSPLSPGAVANATPSSRAAFANSPTPVAAAKAAQETKNTVPPSVLHGAMKQVSNVPLEFWAKYSGKTLQLNKTCAKFPSVLELDFNNLYWQRTVTSNGTVYLFSAYVDVRKQNKQAPTVRLIGMIDRIEPKTKLTCQLWFEGEKAPVFSQVYEYKYMWNAKWGNHKQGILQPYLISCKVPDSHKSKVPAVVSVVEHQCDTATASLRISHEKPEKKKGFAVCVKGLDFKHADMTLRLVEWIELLGILGADKVYLYELQTHPNMSRLLRYYEGTGQVDVKPLTLPAFQPNVHPLQHLYLTRKLVHKRQNEVIPYNDCLYRNMYKYDYIALLDTDEVIVPVKALDWHELMRSIESDATKTKQPDSYNVRNVYFFDDAKHAHGWFADIPPYMHMLQHVYRAKNFTKAGQFVKCFHDTERVLALHNHFPFHCLGSCHSFSVPTEAAQLQHYRKDCVNQLKNTCNDYRTNVLTDTTVWKYKEELIARTAAVLDAIDYTA